MTVDLETVESLTYDEARTFTVLGTPLLKSGKYAGLIGIAPQLWIHAKVYAVGGERQLHRHPQEDHAFFVLAGKATFHDPDGHSTEIGPFEGIMIPRGVFYAFENTSEENLVLVRIGAGETSGGIEADKKSSGAVATMRTEGLDGGKLVKDRDWTWVLDQGRVFTGS